MRPAVHNAPLASWALRAPAAVSARRRAPARVTRAPRPLAETDSLNTSVEAMLGQGAIRGRRLQCVRSPFAATLSTAPFSGRLHAIQWRGWRGLLSVYVPKSTGQSSVASRYLDVNSHRNCVRLTRLTRASNRFDSLARSICLRYNFCHKHTRARYLFHSSHFSLARAGSALHTCVFVTRRVQSDSACLLARL